MVRNAVLKGVVLGAAASLVIAGVAASAATTSDEGGGQVVFASDFEDGSTQGWFGRGSAQVAVSPDQAHSGAASLLTTGRADTWQGPGRDLRAVLQPGVSYEIEAYVRLADAPAADLHMTVQRTPAGGDTAFERIASDVSATDGDWTRIAGSYSFTSTDHDELQLYLESPDPAVSFYLDDVVITAAEAAGDVLISSDFEDGLDGWGPRGDGTNPQVSLTTDGDPRGTQSALVTARTQPWHGIGHDVTTLFAAGSTVHITGWVKLAPDADPDVADIRLSVQRDAAGSPSFDTVATVSGVTADDWVEVSADYTPGSFESALLYFETTSALSEFMVDDILVTGSSAAIDPDIPSLKDVVPVPFGVAIDGRETVGPAAELTLKHFDQITPENHMKPVEIQPSEGEFTFGQADELMQFAQDNGLQVYGHTLVWHSQVGEWMFQDAGGNPLTDSPADQELLRERMRTHIFTFADHFRDEFGEYGDDNPLVAIDVVNEVIAESGPNGLRENEWYRILGPDYIPLAFHTAREAFGPDVMLYINDFNTEFPTKRQIYYDRISEWLDDGVPIDGVGHQLHLSLLQPIPQIAASLELFRDLPVTQAVTELDVTINIGGETWTVPPQERLIEQGYYYRDLFEVLDQHMDVLGAITVWGLTDPRSWRSGGFPLLFDGNLQAKPAYWGIVDPSQLPALTRQANVPAGDVALDESATAAAEWELLPDIALGSAGSGFQLRWTPERLVAYVSVTDPTDDGAADTVEFFWGESQLAVPRTGGAASAVVTSTADGYDVVAQLPVDSLDEGDTVAFDVRLTDGATGAQTSWNDLSHGQEDGERFGVLTMIEPVAYVEVPEVTAAPEIDGAVDEVWADAPVVSTDVQVEGSPGAFAEVRLLWSGSALYALAEVTDPSLDATNSNAWEQDSVEFFLDPVNAKSGTYNPEDGQYRVNFENAVTISGDAPVQDRLTSGTSVTDAGYIVEVAIELGYQPEAGQLIGLELQVNDATNGVRNSVRTWSDPTGRSFQNTSRWGVARLVGAEDPAPECDETVDGLHKGPLTVAGGTTCVTGGATVQGPVTITAGAGLVASGATVSGPVSASDATVVVIHDSKITGPVVIAGTTGQVSLIGNQITGPVRLSGNSTGTEPIVVSDNTITGVLSCSGNLPDPVDAGSPNAVVGVKLGQCRSL